MPRSEIHTPLSDLSKLHAWLEEAFSRTDANGGVGSALLVIHFDHLKDVHETVGRRAGEVLLHQVEDRWSATLKDPQKLAHLGGGEFALFVPGATAQAACAIAERLLEALQEPFVVYGATLELGASIGIAISADQTDNPDTLLRRADMAAAEAMHSEAAYVVYTAADDHDCPERLVMAADLRRAIENDQLVLRYQPQVDVRSGALTAVEALVRWQHPARGLLSPDEFIPLAEQTRLIRPLSRFVLRAAVQQCRAWQADGLDIRVAVNLSVHDLQDSALPDHVAELLTTSGVEPNRICVEITESALLADPQRAREILGRLRALGVHTAIDDFGTGYSSLAYLKDLPLDELKIDRSFVEGMAEDAGARAIVRAVIDLAHDLGLQAIAEGVEDRATQQVLASLGCDVAQGYYFCPPVTADDLTERASRGVDRGLNEGERARADASHAQRCDERHTRLRTEEEFLARKRAEEALRVSEARYRSVVDNIKDVIFQVDMAGCWSLLNPAWEELTGFSVDESIGQKCLDFVHPEDHDLPREFFKSVVAGSDESCRFEMRFLTRRGDFRWVEVFGRLAMDGDAKLAGASGTLSDVTDRRQSEDRRRALQQAEKLRALGQMASGVAHDLNQSLGLVAGYGHIALRALDQEQPDLAALREALLLITQAATDGGKTVRRLLTFARVQPDGEPERLDVVTLLRDVAALTAPRWRDGAQAEGRSLSLVVDAEPALFICGRSASLREALTNLVFNAVDATPNGGTICLTARQSHDQVVVEVTDSGVGMTAEIQARMFEPFFSTKGERGTGLGLAQVFGIIEQHRAEVMVDSMPGRGTTFRLSFAAAPSPPNQLPVSPMPEPEIAAGRRLRILAVDDEPAMGSMIRRMLRPDGHAVVTATAGEEALESLGADRFDLVISDVGLGPRMNGWELAAEIRRRRPGLPVVLATGWGAVIDPDEAWAKGIHAVLAKPYTPADLKNILARLTEPDLHQEAA